MRGFLNDNGLAVRRTITRRQSELKQMIILGITGLLIAVLLAGCATVTNGSDDSTVNVSTAESQSENPTESRSEEGSTTPQGNEMNQNVTSSSLPQTGYTHSVPDSYKSAAENKGTVERLDYASSDYVRNDDDITKTAYVYLPYGYDENDDETKYNILYLMHGWGGQAGEYFNYTSTKNVFDNLIANDDIPPIIIVSATFYNENSDTDFSSSIAEFRQFHLDFEENLMPAVEGKYHTYAEDTTPEALMASRDHRAFGGFSLGSVTTWLEFCYDYDYIRTFIPMSGSCWYYGTYGDFQIENNVDFIEQLVEDNKLDERGYFIYHAVGTNDTVKSQSLDMADEMLSRERFTPEHYVFYQKEGGYHDFDAVQQYLYNALPIIFGNEGTSETMNETEQESNVYTAETAIQDVISDPVFGDYGRLIFPVNTRYYSGTTLGNLNLTWYSNIQPDKTVEIANYLRAHAAAGETVFYDIYTDAEKAADPDKEDTGIFFFRGRSTSGGRWSSADRSGAETARAKFAICNAGGGFAYVGAMHDSFPHALELSKKGYNAFALIYRPGGQTACEDLARAIAFIFEHADELEVDTSDYSLWGGSAGARMAAWLGSYGTESFGEDAYPRPAAVIMQYTGLSEVTGTEPPTYNCVGTSDGIASYRTMQARIDAIKANGTDAEIEIFQGLSHGFGLGTGTVAEGWLDHAVEFWERNSN